MAATFHLVHAAGNMFDRTTDRHAIITEACQHGDVVTLSEVVDDHAFIRNLPNFDVSTVGELSVMWKTARFARVAQGHEQVMVGGRRGAGLRAGDRRRRGPNRLVIWVLLRDRESGQQVLIFTHHAIAKADTAHKWRRRLRAQGFRGTVNVVVKVGRRHPGVPKILDGDLNTIGKIVAFLRADLAEVTTPPTYGRLRYDRIFASSDALVSRVRRIRTAGDHRALWAIVTLGAPAHTPAPKPERKEAADADAAA